jgi:hypothetical protein
VSAEAAARIESGLLGRRQNRVEGLILNVYDLAPVSVPIFADKESMVVVEFVWIAACKFVWSVAKLVSSGVTAVSAFVKMVVACVT